MKQQKQFKKDRKSQTSISLYLPILSELTSIKLTRIMDFILDYYL